MATRQLRNGLAALTLAAAAMLAAWSPSVAAERQRDHVYADSYGNLVIYSRAGFKRIIVGKGYLADELASYDGADDGPVVIRGDEAITSYRDCYSRPVLVKGRGYMYGLADGEAPQLAGSCYD